MKQLALKCLFFGLLIIGFSSCEDKLRVSYYDTGEKYEEYQYIADSIKHGTYRKYSKSGFLMETSNYFEGELEGERIIYNFYTGIKEISEIYKNDILNGRYIVFHPNGEMNMFGVYEDNVLSGTVSFYDSTGELNEHVQFLNNYEVIPFKEFHENGKIKWEGTKRIDRHFGITRDYGVLIEYNEEGELIRKMTCDEREICTTIWTIDGSHLKKTSKK